MNPLTIHNLFTIILTTDIGRDSQTAARQWGEERGAVCIVLPLDPPRNPNLTKGEKCLWKNSNVSVSADAARS